MSILELKILASRGILELMKEGHCKGLGTIFDQYPKFTEKLEPEIDSVSYDQLVNEIEEYVLTELETLHYDPSGSYLKEFNTFLKCFKDAGGDINKLGLSLLPAEYTICARLYQILSNDDIFENNCTYNENYEGMLERMIKEQDNIIQIIKDNPSNIQLTKEDIKKLNVLDEDGYSRLYHALYDDPQIAQVLINSGVNLNIKNGLSRQPTIQAAISTNNLPVLKLLLENSVNIDIPNNLGHSALHYAIIKEKPEMVKELLEHGAKINIQHNQGDTPLQSAVRQGFVDITEILLEKDANPNLTNIEGETALHIAVRKGFVDITKLLIKNGANVNVTNSEGKSAKDIARNNPKILALFN